MKKIFILVVMILFAFITGCSSRKIYVDTQLKPNFIQSNWVQSIDTSPRKWLLGADSWFLTGEPNNLEKYHEKATIDDTYTSEVIRVPQFRNIDITGSFEVHITSQDHNSITIMGPNADTQKISVRNYKNTLIISQNDTQPLRHGLVKIGIRNLRNLIVRGNALVYGRDIESDHLNIYASGFSSISLIGRINLAHVSQMGSGVINIFKTCTPSLTIHSIGSGSVNISGRIGIESIVNKGNGTVNIIGADTDRLEIDAANNAIVRIAGYSNLKRVSASQCAKVYVYCINGPNLIINASDYAKVALAGKNINTTVNLVGSANFDGRLLQSHTSYVKTLATAHANIAATTHTFASAIDNSSIYYFGSTRGLAKYSKNNGTIYTISGLDSPCGIPLEKLSVSPCENMPQPLCPPSIKAPNSPYPSCAPTKCSKCIHP